MLTAKVQKIEDGYEITFPDEVVDALALEEGTEMVVYIETERIVLMRKDQRNLIE